eukprot:symbB.v1.2.012692.t1/scaffold880.1/size155533/14
MRQRWRIVEDANRASARRRKQLGLGPLEDPSEPAARRQSVERGTPGDRGQLTQMTKEEMAAHLGRGPETIEKEQVLKRDALHVFRRLQHSAPEERPALYVEAVNLFDSLESRGFSGMGALTSAKIVFCNAVMESCATGGMATLTKLACFSEQFSWLTCCSSTFGPTGNFRCWDEVQGYSYATCCILASWNQHDANIPYFFAPTLRVELHPVGRNDSLELMLHQRSALGQSAADLVTTHGKGWTSGLLWTGSYQLLRWYECLADLPPSMWLQRKYIEFGGGVGASSIAAAFNGAFVTLVDAFVTIELLDNLEVNLPADVRARVQVCQMNWTQPLKDNLAQLETCMAAPNPLEREVKFDLIGVGTAIYSPSYMMPLIHSISKPSTRVFVAPSVSMKLYMDSQLHCILGWNSLSKAVVAQERWGRHTSRYFEQMLVRSDMGLTEVHRSQWAPHCGDDCPFFELSRPRGLPRIAPLVVAHKGPACTAAFAETAGEKVLDLLLECFT